MANEAYMGSIQMFAFNFPPRNYATCDGQILSISQNTALFSLLGTTYGGNGVQTFALPDLRGRVPIHMGQDPSGSSYTIGEVGGSESVTLTTLQMPTHTHSFSNNGSSLNAIATKATAQAPTAGAQLARGADKNGTDIPQIYVPTGTTGDSVALAGLNVAGTNSLTGGSQPTPIMQPYLTINFSIALYGIFPTRN